MIEMRGLSSSSFFSDDVCFPNEGQVGSWKSETMMDQHACEKSIASSCRGEISPAELKTAQSLGHYRSFSLQDQNLNTYSKNHAVGAEIAANNSMTFSRPMCDGMGISTSNGRQDPYSAEGNKVHVMASESENSLFSSSMSDLFSRKLRLSSQGSLYGHSIDTIASHCEEEEPFESLEEVEAQTIGNLLPSDDDFFSGVTGGFNKTIGPNRTEEAEELDLFSSVGGMDLGDDGHPSRPPANPTSGFSVSHAPNSSSYMDSRSMFHVNASSSMSNLPSMSRVESVGSLSSVAESGHFQGHFDVRAAPTFHPHSLPNYHDGPTRGTCCNSASFIAPNMNTKRQEIIGSRHLRSISSSGHPLELNDHGFTSASNGSHQFPGNPYTLSNSYHQQTPGMMWHHSPPVMNGIRAAQSSGRLHGLPMASSHMPNTVLNSHHVGSAPTVNASIWDRRHISPGESLEVSGFHPGSFSMSANSSPHNMEHISRNIFPHGGNCMDLSMHQKHGGFQSLHPRSPMYAGRGHAIPMMNSVDSPHERSRSRRNEGSVNHADKKQFELDIDRIIRGEDKRTTLMIKNIPNKYTSKMLLAAIDERHRGTYDFIYLPIDFKNKCNVGYAFINMIEPSHIVPLYQAFNGKKWEKFNSEKVASLAYARIQGKSALIAHFQNSSLMNEDKRCRPILFNTEGPNAGDQVPFPMGVNVRTRPGKPRSSFHDEYNQESSPRFANGENCSANE